MIEVKLKRYMLDTDEIKEQATLKRWKSGNWESLDCEGTQESFWE